MKQTHYLTIIAILAALLLLKTCQKETIQPPKTNTNVKVLEKQIGLLKSQLLNAKDNIVIRDTIYKNRVKYIKEVLAPDTCITYIEMVERECDSLVKVVTIPILIQDTIIAKQDTVITALKAEVKKQRKQKRLILILWGIREVIGLTAKAVQQ